MFERLLLLGLIWAGLVANAVVTTRPALTGLSAAVGQAFNELDGSIYFTEWTANRISYFNPASNSSGVLFAGVCTGGGAANPQDIAVSPSEKVLGKAVFYVTCRNGYLFKLSWGIKALGIPPRPPVFGWVKTTITLGLGMPHQVQLDGLGFAYTVDYQFGRVLKIKLADGTVTQLAGGLTKPIGIILTSDLTKAYVSLDGVLGFRIVKLLTGDISTVLSYTTDNGQAVTNPFYLLWDTQDQSFYVTSRDKRFLMRFALNTVPAKATTTVSNLPILPSSVCRGFSHFALYVASDSVLTEVSWFLVFPGGLAKPTIYRLGHVPSTNVNSVTGLATTDPGYFFQVKNAPFGGSVQMFFNFQKMRSLNAAYYKVSVDGTPQFASWSNYKWIAGSFELRAVAPDGLGRYAVPTLAEFWAYQDLGFVLDTTKLTNNALHTLSVTLYKSNGAAITIPFLLRSMESVTFLVDNIPPHVYINSIQQFPGTPIAECGLLTTGSSKLIFNVTAYDPLGYLNSWSLSDQYGHGHSAGIESDVYDPTHAGSPQWFGVQYHTVSFDLCSTTVQCAHEFYLDATSRAIDGYNHIFYRSDFETLAVYLNPVSACPP